MDENKNSKLEFFATMYDDFNDIINASPEELEAFKAKKANEKKVQALKKESTPNSESYQNQTDIKLEKLLKKIDDSHLTADSKVTLKKMIDYAKKYNAGIVKKYIPFNMRIYCDNDETLYSIINLITEGFSLFGYIKDQEAIERSFFVIEEPKHITDLYDSQNSIVIFKNCDGMTNKDKLSKDKLLNVLETSILDYSNYYGVTTIITDINKEKVDTMFENKTTLKDKIFDFELYTDKADNQEVYQTLLNAFKKDYVISGEFELDLLEYVTETYSKTPLSSPEYISSVTEQILFNHTGDVIKSESIPKYEKNKSLDEIFQDLNDLIGLDNVKQMLRDLASLISFKKKTKDELDLKNTNLHMVFLGNPGTGKTTVARMVAGILYNLDFIKQNKLIEVSAKDLIGQYVGQTGPKTMEVVEKALGGVLFIDEAYSLASKPGNNASFNEECVATLIQAMENYRDNLVVIFAGYSKEMSGFLKSNSGIISRIGYTMEFKDYTVEELITILDSMFTKAGFLINNEALGKAKQIILEFYNTEGFGNARFVRNLYEKAIIKHATNTEGETDKTTLKTITAKDIVSDNLGKI